MAISLLAYVATFSGQLYFWRNYFFTLLQSNSFDTTVIFSEQLFLQNRYVFWGASIFRTVTSLQQSFLQNSNFFRAKLAQSSHFLRIGNSLREALFGTPTFLVEKLFRTKTFQKRYFLEPGTSAQHQLFWKLLFRKKLFFGKALFRIAYISWIATILEGAVSEHPRFHNYTLYLFIIYLLLAQY